MMRSSTIAFSVGIGSLVLATAQWQQLAICAASSLLPDIDMSRSTIGRLLPFISKPIENRFAHRTITHSFAASITLALALYPLVLLGWDWVWRSIVVGYSLGWFSDTFTKAGVCAFWPAPHRLVMGSNPRYRITTGSVAERFVLALLIALAIASISIQTNGGLYRVFIQTLGTTSGAVAQFEEYGATNLTYLQILKGFDAETLQLVDGRYRIIQRLSQNTLLIEDDRKRPFAAGGASDVQFRVQRARVDIGDPVAVEVLEVFPDYETVSQLLEPFATSDAYISGTFRTDSAYDLPTNSPRHYNTVRIQPLGRGDAIVVLESAAITKVLADVGEWFATSGEFSIRVYERTSNA